MSRASEPIFSAAFCASRVLVVVLLGSAVSCDRMVTTRKAQLIKDADAKVNSGEYQKAIELYETALDGSANSADVHYRLAVLYDDKLNEPLHALHHFKRYLVLAPSGPRANDVKNFMKRDELALVTSLSGDSVLTRAEAAGLKNENLALHKQIEEARAHSAGTAIDTQTKKNAAKSPGGSRSYVVRRGDTLASISRKFYKTSAHWKRILDANRKTVDDPENLKVGETLTIP